MDRPGTTSGDWRKLAEDLRSQIKALLIALDVPDPRLNYSVEHRECRPDENERNALNNHVRRFLFDLEELLRVKK